MASTTMPDWKIGGGFGGGFGGPANFDSMDRFEVGGFGRREFTTNIPWITFETTQLPTTTLKTPKNQGQSFLFSYFCNRLVQSSRLIYKTMSKF